MSVPEAAAFKQPSSSTPPGREQGRCFPVGKDHLVEGTTRMTRRFAQTHLDERERGRVAGACWQIARNCFSEIDHDPKDGAIHSCGDGYRSHSRNFRVYELRIDAKSIQSCVNNLG